ncbi:MAG: hypothetical protein IPJ18_20505 [Betaproteobacteria bacterium]|nr:hypothetical protein [Betaproteobacteria bacterium]
MAAAGTGALACGRQEPACPSPWTTTACRPGSFEALMSNERASTAWYAMDPRRCSKYWSVGASTAICQSASRTRHTRGCAGLGRALAGAVLSKVVDGLAGHLPWVS